MARKKIRGRANDQDYEQELKNTRHQLACIGSSYIQDEWMIDNSDMMVESLRQAFSCIRREKRLTQRAPTGGSLRVFT